MEYTILKGEISVYKILILDESEVFCRSLAELLPEEFEPYLLQDGSRFAEYLQKIKPDFLVLDLAVSHTDALYVLEAAHFAGIRPCVLALTNCASPYIDRLLDQLQVSYAVMKPCNMVQLAARIADMALDCQLQLMPEKTVLRSEVVEHFLRYLGFYPHLKGYKMLVTGICIMMDNPYISLTKGLYPAVAEIWGAEWKQVEHAIRNCIANAYKRRDDWIWRMYFPCDPDKKLGHLKNSVFLSCVAAHLRDTSLDAVVSL